jgi:hypothetical protein
MDEMPSSEFRRRYAALTKPTVVTAGGRPIGQWIPASHRLSVMVDLDGAVTIDPPPMKGQPVEISMAVDRFSTRPFTPVPKGK